MPVRAYRERTCFFSTKGTLHRCNECKKLCYVAESEIDFGCPVDDCVGTLVKEVPVTDK